jgi:ferredoxin
MKVKFVPQNVEHEIKPGESVMHVAQDHGLYIKSVCKGVPSCAECRVRVVEGEHNVLPPNSEELSLIGTGHFIDHRRLSCQLKCFGDITVDLTEQVEKQQLGGKKSKGLAAKSDRVEDETAIRSSQADEPEGGNEREEAGASGEAGQPEVAPRPKREGGHRDGGRREGARGPQGKCGGEGGAQARPNQPQQSGGEGDRKRRRRRRGGGKGGGGGGQGGGQGGGGSKGAPV